MKKKYFVLTLLTYFIISGYAQSDSEPIRAINQAEVASTHVAQTLTTKSEADSAYIRNDFAAAIEMYEYILENKGESADIYYNLGNSYYKLDYIAKAVLNYERALLLSPNDRDIRFNLELARSKTVDKIIPLHEIFFITWIQSLINTMNEKAWACMAIVMFILMILALSLFIFSKHVVFKKVGFISTICFFIITILANIFALEQKSKLINHNNAIIMTPSVTVKSTPSQNGTDLFILHEGQKVIIKDNTMKEWKEIKLEDGNVGWVPANIIEII